MTGACLAACLTQMLEQRTDDSLIPADFTHPPFKFVIIVSGFIPLQQKATRRTLLSAPRTVKTPSMHLIGEVDTLIAPERMYALADAFSDPFIFRHAGGYVRQKNETKKALLTHVGIEKTFCSKWRGCSQRLKGIS